MDSLTEFLPFCIVLAMVQVSLWGYALYHILTHETYRRGNRTLWLLVTILLMEFVGPILYFLFGKEDI